MIKLSSLCTKCGTSKESSIPNVNFTHKVEEINSEKYKIYCEITVVESNDELCKTCYNLLNLEELRLHLCTLSKVTKPPYISNNYKFKQICKCNPWDDSIESDTIIANYDTINLDKKIRYIDANGNFGTAQCGRYLFHEKSLYIKDKGLDDIQPSELDIKNNRRIYSKVMYAGHDTGFLDDDGKSIYTGDVIRIKGSWNSERNHYRYFKKDRCIPKDNQFYEVSGVVTHHIFFEDYNVVCDMSGAFLCHGYEMELLGNIFFKLDPDSHVNIRSIAASIGQSGFEECSNMNDVYKVKNYLKGIDTPSFNTPTKKEQWWHIFKTK